MYTFFYGTFTCASTNNLDSAMNSTFHVGGSSPRTNTTDSSIAQTPWKKRKQIKGKAGTGERSQMEIPKKFNKVGGSGFAYPLFLLNAVSN